MNTNPLFDLKADIFRITRRLDLIAGVDAYKLYSDTKATLITDGRPTYNITVTIEDPEIFERDSVHEFYF